MLKTELALLKDVTVTQEGAAGECRLEDAMEKMKEMVPPSTLEMTQQTSDEEEPGEEELRREEWEC